MDPACAEYVSRFAATEFGTTHKFQNVALAVPLDHENGPSPLNIDPEADTTVIVYKDQVIRATHSIGKGELDDSKVAAIVKDTTAMLP